MEKEKNGQGVYGKVQKLFTDALDPKRKVVTMEEPENRKCLLSKNPMVKEHFKLSIQESLTPAEVWRRRNKKSGYTKIQKRDSKALLNA